MNLFNGHITIQWPGQMSVINKPGDPDLQVIVAGIQTINDPNRLIIAIDGKIPWTIKEDLVHFRKSTLNCCIIMGHKTWLTLPKRPLYRRYNIIISVNASSDERLECENIYWAVSLNDAIAHARTRGLPIWIIGGDSIYTQLVNDPIHRMMIEQLLITQISEKALPPLSSTPTVAEMRYFPLKAYLDLAGERGYITYRRAGFDQLIKEYQSIIYNQQQPPSKKSSKNESSSFIYQSEGDASVFFNGF